MATYEEQAVGEQVEAGRHLEKYWNNPDES